LKPHRGDLIFEVPKADHHLAEHGVDSMAQAMVSTGARGNCSASTSRCADASAASLNAD
jgi:hypothetical protein